MASERFLDGFCFLFGSWTVLCHLAVLAGAGLDQLLFWTLATALAAAGICLRRRSRPPGHRPPGHRPLEVGRDPGATPAATPRRAHPAFALAPPALVALAAAFPWPLPWLWWTAAVAYFATAAAMAGGLAAPAAVRRRVKSPRAATRQVLVWTLALLAVALTWTVNRPDADDAFYLGIAVAAADFPGQPLLRDDPVHGVAGVPIHHPAYRLHALEVAVGALTRLTGIAAIYWSHLAVSGLGALLMVLAWGRLIRLLVPGRWVATLSVLLLIFATAGDVHRWYGNFGFVRLHQGKAVFVSAVLPLIVAYAVELALAPRARRWLKLAVCQAAAVGLTPIAIWIAPVVAGLALAAAVGWNRRGLRVAALGALASVYPLIAGATLAVALESGPPRPARTVSRASLERALERLPPPAFLEEGAWEPMIRARSLVLGDGALALCVVLASALAWWLAPERLARRVGLVFPLGFLICCFNPVAAELVRGAVGDKLYWRAMWVLPAPLLIALCLTAPLAAAGRRRRWPRRRAVVALAAAFALLVPERQLLTRGNGVSFRPLGLKVPPSYPVAEAVAKSAPAGSAVLAPLAVSPWVVTFHRHPNPLVVRKIYLPALRRHLGRREVAERLRLGDLVTGTGAGRRPRMGKLLRAIPRYGLASICLRRGDRWHSDPGLELAGRGFELAYRDAEYEIWRRPGPRGGSRDTLPP